MKYLVVQQPAFAVDNITKDEALRNQLLTILETCSDTFAPRHFCFERGRLLLGRTEGHGFLGVCVWDDSDTIGPSAGLLSKGDT